MQPGSTPHATAAAKKKKNKKKKNKNKRGEKPVPVWQKRHGGPNKDVPEEDDFHSNSEEDYSDTQEERKDEYRKGGYHPVVEGELYNNRYRIVKKLGWGYFSTVWLAWDHDKEEFRALKIQKSAEHYREAAYDEIKLLGQIRESDPNDEFCCCLLTDHFEHRGPNGRHVVMVFEVLGNNLLSLITKYEYKGIPIPIVKHITRQVLIGLDYLHRHLGILHTDLKPENVLLARPTAEIREAIRAYKPPTDRSSQLPLTARDPSTLSKAQKKRLKAKLKKRGTQPTSGETGEKDPTGEKDEEDEPETADSAPPKGDEETKAEGDTTTQPKPAEDETQFTMEELFAVKIADFGNGCWIDRQFTDDIQTRQYRAPEVILGTPYSTPVDVWSCACLVFELLTGEFLFDPRASEYYDRDEDHLALITELMGPLPDNLVRAGGKYADRYLDANGNLKHINQLKFWPIEDVLHQKYRFTAEKAAEIGAFLRPMLATDPHERASAASMLSHPWLEIVESDNAPLCFVLEGEEDVLDDTASAGEDEGEGENEEEQLLDDSPHSEHGIVDA
eukprot:TRINITY_DN3042_c0_g1_i1.p1 TRINITY_DN3042_c0_g1~~TRINITY_DN3042_c0_g1_i1.p1  ORF type:complete len:559 (+),score=103.77 TRINITY_DN3042_c0_g1_i1:66-1742(+)